VLKQTGAGDRAVSFLWWLYSPDYSHRFQWLLWFILVVLPCIHWM